jgi:hypothetical protein
MALFNPPLHKRGNRSCPNCGHAVGWWTELMWKNPWSKWDCPECQSVLGIDLGRRAVDAIVVGVPFALVLILGNLHTWPGWTRVSFFAGWVVLFLLAWWWFDSVVVRRPAEQPGRAS